MLAADDEYLFAAIAILKKLKRKSQMLNFGVKISKSQSETKTKQK